MLLNVNWYIQVCSLYTAVTGIDLVRMQACIHEQHVLMTDTVGLEIIKKYLILLVAFSPIFC